MKQRLFKTILAIENMECIRYYKHKGNYLEVILLGIEGVFLAGCLFVIYSIISAYAPGSSFMDDILVSFCALILFVIFNISAYRSAVPSLILRSANAFLKCRYRNRALLIFQEERADLYELFTELLNDKSYHTELPEECISSVKAKQHEIELYFEEFLVNVAETFEEKILNNSLKNKLLLAYRSVEPYYQIRQTPVSS
jgi:hypothetical protein